MTEKETSNNVKPEEAVRLVKAFVRIADPRQRLSIIERAEQLAEMSAASEQSGPLDDGQCK